MFKTTVTETVSATVTQQLHSWPVSRALARSAAEDSQLASGEQLGQFGAAGYAVGCTRRVGVVLCTRAAVTIRWLRVYFRGLVEA